MEKCEVCRFECGHLLDATIPYPKIEYVTDRKGAMIKAIYTVQDKHFKMCRSCYKKIADVMECIVSGIEDSYALEQAPCEDLVSRAELKKWLDMNFSFGGASRKLELFDRLDKELPPVTPQPTIYAVQIDVLDKIRAEMLEEMLSHSGTGEEVIQAYVDGLKKGLKILDKYKSETEVEDGNVD